MNINIRPKLRSLIRRNQNFFCLSFDWNSRQIIVHQTEQQYINQLLGLHQNGLVKRAECYVDQVLSINDKNYMIYMISFGDFRKGKMVKGQNPLSKGLGVCLFDYVYIFVDEISQAQKRMEQRIQELERRGEFFHRNLIIQVYSKYFRDRQETTASLLNYSDKLQQKQQSIQI